MEVSVNPNNYPPTPMTSEVSKDAYEQDLDLVETYENLPEDDQNTIHLEAMQLMLTNDSLGSVEAIAQIMRERNNAGQPSDENL